MSEQNNGQIGHEGVSGHGQWKRRFGLMGIIMVALLLLPPLPPWLRIMAAALPAWAVLEGFDLLPRLRAEWQRVISALPSDHEREARWLRALSLIGLLAVVLILLPPPAAALSCHRICRRSTDHSARRTRRLSKIARYV